MKLNMIIPKVIIPEKYIHYFKNRTKKAKQNTNKWIMEKHVGKYEKNDKQKKTNKDKSEGYLEHISVS